MKKFAVDSSVHVPCYLQQRRTKHKVAQGEMAAVGKRKVEQKEGRIGEWKDRHDGSMEAQMGHGPCGVLGIAVMLTDVWLFASAFTVNTHKNTEQNKRKRTK